MKKSIKLHTTLVAVFSVSTFTAFASSDVTIDSKLKNIVDENAAELMKEYGIPGLAVAVTVDGERYYYDYGVADKETNSPITNETIFELGSVSKTFAATLAGYAEQKGKLNMGDKVSAYMPELNGSPLGEAKLLHIATYTAGGLPLQFPSEVTDHQGMINYYQSWQPEFEAGEQRRYSNPSIGLYGYIGALSMKSDYTEMMEKVILPKLGMANTFVNVPSNLTHKYAFGYNAKNEAVRVSPGVLDAEAYGIKSTSADMLHFIEANMGKISLSDDIEKAIESTHKGYFDVGPFTQAVGWESYDYPVSLQDLLKGNSREITFASNPVTESQSSKLGGAAWVNKTGSTGGFGAYVAYVPSEKIGVVILANKSYPINERVEAAYDIISAITQ
ncbi:class C beta-lactamase [Vibrio sp. YT-17]|uniref:class C beta-lactamase n=1 Tax=Vibrio sp. YT-17 TaxID=3074708 RepID=UPI00296459DE|nr:class C beta-lactamase [Vibrio sp. YT-17]MDW1539128.1 class C beta-lactamase [Vibrio sp. YT-17]